MSTVPAPMTSTAPDTTTSTSSTSTTVTEPDVPEPLPAGLRAPVELAAQDRAAVYTNGCHVDQLAVEPPSLDLCTFGMLSAATTVVLFGDSHAAQWMPAFDAAGRSAGFRVVSITKSGCPSAMVPTLDDGKPYVTCDAWRDAALATIVAMRPDLVVLANYPLQTVVGADGASDAAADPTAWIEGLAVTADALEPTVPVALLGPTPLPKQYVPPCLAANPDDIRPCHLRRTASTRPDVIDGERRVADDRGLTFADPTEWLCDAVVCPAVLDGMLVYRDRSHLAATYSASLAGHIEAFVADAIG